MTDTNRQKDRAEIKRTPVLRKYASMPPVAEENSGRICWQHWKLAKDLPNFTGSVASIHRRSKLLCDIVYEVFDAHMKMTRISNQKALLACPRCGLLAAEMHLQTFLIVCANPSCNAEWRLASGSDLEQFADAFIAPGIKEHDSLMLEIGTLVTYRGWPEWQNAEPEGGRP